jgi:hypothetical protein
MLQYKFLQIKIKYYTTVVRVLSLLSASKVQGDHKLMLSVGEFITLYRVFQEKMSTNNNTNSIVYATLFINLCYTTCFDPNGSSSGASSYTLFTYWIEINLAIQ